MPDSPATIAIVDDDQFMRTFLMESLASAGYQCQTFASAGEVLSWLASGEGHPDLLLSDLNMPGMSGLDLLRTLKVISPDLELVMISGSGDLPVAHRALRAGAADYLIKPVRPADLLELVSRVLVKT